MAIALRLSHEWHVLPIQILRSPVDHVLAMLNYSNVMAEAQETAGELNKDSEP